MTDFSLSNYMDQLLTGQLTAPVEVATKETDEPVRDVDQTWLELVLSGRSEKAFDESKHPRGGKGSPQGGKFVSKAEVTAFNASSPADQEKTWLGHDEEKRQAMIDAGAKVNPATMESISKHMLADEGPKPKNFSQQADEQAAARGMVQGKHDWEKPTGARQLHPGMIESDTPPGAQHALRQVERIAKENGYPYQAGDPVYLMDKQPSDSISEVTTSDTHSIGFPDRNDKTRRVYIYPNK